MATRMSLDERIEKVEAAVAAAKKKYDAALQAYHSGQKTADEIIAFINAGEDSKEVKRPIKRTYKRH